MPKVTLNIDGKEILAEEGSNLLEVARQNGIPIPSLCHDPRLEPFGACRQCLVEIDGSRGAVQACGAKVQEGMIVRTSTPNIIGLRRLGLELLISDHSGDCIAPCQKACPAGIDIQGFIAHIANGQVKQAAKLIKERLPLAASVGRICPRFCEAKCRRTLIDGPVSICALKRFAGDFELSDGEACTPSVKHDTGKQVAIIGGGPAGLSTAYFLALEGHRVSIFDASSELGGMMRYGIPEYRLSKEVLDQEIKAITDMCQAVFCNRKLGRDFTVQQLREAGFDAVFISVGSWANQSLGIPGEDLVGVYSGISFLHQVALKEAITVGNKVVVIGGGNTAMDAVRTSIRLGAPETTLVYRRSREEMPASPHEIVQAEEEGAKFELLTAPLGFIGEAGKVRAIQCIKMRLGEPDHSGRRRPEPIQGSEFEIPADMVITATGQKLEKESLLGSPEVDLTQRGCIKVNKDTLQGSAAWLFAGGDCETGPATVVEAIAAGRKAAVSIDKYLQGHPVVPVQAPFNCTRGELEEIDPAEFADREKIPRVIIPTLEPAIRKADFNEFEFGITAEMAKRETERCLSCGCQDVFTCQLRDYATQLKVEPEKLGYGKHKYPVLEDHPYIVRDSNKCVLCGNCVRICEEVQGIGALGFVNRGSETVVMPSLKSSLTETMCNSCGQCISICPTGALTQRSILPKRGPWRTQKAESICPYCNIGCKLELNVVGNQVVSITSPINKNSVNEGDICVKGSFGYPFGQGSERLSTPLIAQNGVLEKVGWDEAIAAAGKLLRDVGETSGLDSVAVAVSPRMTNEENELAYKLGRIALGTNQIYGTVPVVTGSAELGNNTLNSSFADLRDSDLILLVDGDISTHYPIVAHKIKKAVAGGSKLLMISPRASELDSLAKFTLKVNKNELLRLIQLWVNYVMRYNLVDAGAVRSHAAVVESLHGKISEDFAEIASSFWVKPDKIIEFLHLYLRAKKPVIVVDGNNITSEELELLQQFALITGNLFQPAGGMLTLYPQGNIQGQLDIGVKADTREFSDLIDKMKSGRIKGLLILSDGSDLDERLFQSGVKTVLVNPVLNKEIAAEVIIPGAAFVESNGSFTNCEGRIQRISAGVLPVAGKENGQILNELASALGFAE